MGMFGVISDVGLLRKGIVHRPELRLKRLTPTNHDELLFDDIRWVERAQREHDAFVDVLTRRAAEVYYVQDFLGDARIEWSDELVALQIPGLLMEKSGNRGGGSDPISDASVLVGGEVS